MTVAAIVLGSGRGSAMHDAAGRPACRRIADAAWAGGAVPIVVAPSGDRDTVASALAGCSAVVAPAGPVTVGRLARSARRSVRATTAVLLWPDTYAWVGPETVTSLIEAHGVHAGAVLRPAWEDRHGWPALVPAALADRADAAGARTADEVLRFLAGARAELLLLDLGDPGTVHPLPQGPDDLPAYRGPAAPAATPPDWGAAAAEGADR